jgi:hypothetical protein
MLSNRLKKFPGRTTRMDQDMIEETNSAKSRVDSDEAKPIDERPVSSS